MKRRPSLSSNVGNGSRRPSLNSNCSNLSDDPDHASGSNTPKTGIALSSEASSNRSEKIVRIDSSLTSTYAAYRLNWELGRGAASVVYKATNIENEDEFVAVKRYPLKYFIDKDKESCLNSIESEIVLLKSLDHPNVVKYIGTRISTNNLYLVLEYMGSGSLASLVKREGGLSESIVAYFVEQILLGLIYLHNKGVIHRDIKGANILIARDSSVKLADFGAALNLGKAMRKGNEVAGSPYWMAPEVIDMKPLSPACDVWALGCTITEMLTGKPPLYDEEPVAALFHIVREAPPPAPQGVSALLADCLGHCMRKIPSERATAEVLHTHPFLLCKERLPEQPCDVEEQNNRSYKSDQGAPMPIQESCMPAMLPASAEIPSDNSNSSMSYCNVM